LGIKIYIQKKIGLKVYLKHFLILIVGLILASCQVNNHLKDGEYLVEKNQVKFNGTSIDHAELESYLRQKPNRKILKAVPFNLWLYFQIDQKKMLSYKAKRNLKFDRINQKRIAKNTKKNEANSERHKGYDIQFKINGC
jgi:hypothetical protein